MPTSRHSNHETAHRAADRRFQRAGWPIPLHAQADERTGPLSLLRTKPARDLTQTR